MKNNATAGAYTLESGQIWRMAELRMQVDLVGKLLVHYKLAKHDAVRIPNSIGSKTSIEKYLKTNKAVLVKKLKLVDGIPVKPAKTVNGAKPAKSAKPAAPKKRVAAKK